VSDICKTTYEEIKKDKKHRYVVFFIKDEKQIDVETIGKSNGDQFRQFKCCRQLLMGCRLVFVGSRDAAYDQFLEDLQKGGSGECRYGLFDFEYTHQCQGTSEVS
jgi:cofilin